MTDVPEAPAEALPSSPERGDPAYLSGVALTLGTAIAWSFSGLLWRGVESAPVWTVIFYRAISLALALALFLLIRYRARLPAVCLAIGPAGCAAGVCLGIGSVFFLLAVMNTTIANVSFLTAATPLVAAVLGWVLLKERVRASTWSAMAVALAGVLVMVYEGIAGGGWYGNLMAIGAAFCSAGYAIALRFGRQADQMPAVMLGGVVSALFAVPFLTEFRISANDYLMCATQGVVISAGCNVLFAYAARSVPAAEICVLALLEVCLSPTWVWLFVGETPSALGLLGGLILLAAVVIYSIASVRSVQIESRLPESLAKAADAMAPIAPSSPVAGSAAMPGGVKKAR